jgi:hypothetical protein
MATLREVLIENSLTVSDTSNHSTDKLVRLADVFDFLSGYGILDKSAKSISMRGDYNERV